MKMMTIRPENCRVTAHWVLRPAVTRAQTEAHFFARARAPRWTVFLNTLRAQ